MISYGHSVCSPLFSIKIIILIQIGEFYVQILMLEGVCFGIVDGRVGAFCQVNLPFKSQKYGSATYLLVLGII